MIKKIKNISKYIINSESALRIGMKRLDKVSDKKKQFLIIVDNSNKLLGTLTDGDIRRAILAGMLLEDKIINAGNLSPIFGNIDEDEKNSKLLKELSVEAAFLPVIDRNHIVKEILISKFYSLRKVDVIIMAGGFGKRLGSKTKNTPKPLLEVKGKPILDSILEKVHSSVSIENIYISVHYLSNKIIKHIEKKKYNTSIEFINESLPLGTAGSLALVPNNGRPLLVLNADLITNLDLDIFINFHFESNNNMTIAASKYVFEVPFGVIEYDSSGSFVRLNEKPKINNFISAGMYILDETYRNIIKKNEFMDMPDVVDKFKSLGKKVAVFPLHEEWRDIGRPVDLEIAQNNRKGK